MEKKVIIAGDSTGDLSPELMKKYGVKTVPLNVGLGVKQYLDGIDINPDMIYKHYEENKELPKTAAPSIAAIDDFFAENTADGSAIVFFTISSDMSSTYNNARLASESYEDVYVVDTRNLSTGGGLLIVAAAEMAESGMGAKEIARACEDMRNRVDASFVIDDLEFLYKGGRCSALAAFGANMLQLKPCITVTNGKMSVAKKYRGKFAVVLKKYIEDRLGDGSDLIPDHVFVTHAGCDEEIWKECVEQVAATGIFKEIHVTRAGCTVSAHCGRNTLGVLFVRNHPITEIATDR